MKILALIACFFLCLALVDSAPSKYRLLKRKCERICQVFGGILDSRYSRSGFLTEREVKDVLALSIRNTEVQKEIFVPAFLMHIDDIREYMERRGEGRKLCRKVKVCKSLLNRVRGRTTGANKCKLCTHVTSVIRDSLIILNTTFYSFGSLAERTCNLFATDKKGLSQCLKIVDAVKNMETAVAEKTKPVDVCQIIGVCGNVSLDRERCVEGFRSISPWGTALSLLKKGTNLMFGEPEDAGKILTSIHEEDLFTHLKQCMEDVWQGVNKGKERNRRSIEVSDCPLCEQMERAMSSEIERKAKGIGEQLTSLCDEVSLTKRPMCHVIAHLANSTGSIPQFIMSKELCHKLACPKNTIAHKPCEVCKKVKSAIETEMQALNALVGLVAKEVRYICSGIVHDDKKMKCKAIELIVTKLGNAIFSVFDTTAICTKLGLC